MNIITKYVDYDIDSINFFLKEIREGINARGMNNLTNGQVDAINVSKEHPLVQYMASAIAASRNADMLRTGMLPCVSVTPGHLDPEMQTMAMVPQIYDIDDEQIEYFKSLLKLSDEDRFNEGLLTTQQIENIIMAYRRLNGKMRCEKHTWGYNEELNISCWSESPDYDSLMVRIVDSVLAGLKVGVMGDNSKLRNMQYKIDRGLTNFNYGRVLYGSEINLTFFNRYSNYTIFTEENISGFTFNPTFISPGETE